MFNEPKHSRCILDYRDFPYLRTYHKEKHVQNPQIRMFVYVQNHRSDCCIGISNNSNNSWSTVQNQAEQELPAYSKVFSKDIPRRISEFRRSRLGSSRNCGRKSAHKVRSVCGLPVRFGGSVRPKSDCLYMSKSAESDCFTVS